MRQRTSTSPPQSHSKSQAQRSSPHRQRRSVGVSMSPTQNEPRHSRRGLFLVAWRFFARFVPTRLRLSPLTSTADPSRLPS
jgi:hypothetical protein